MTGCDLVQHEPPDGAPRPLLLVGELVAEERVEVVVGLGRRVRLRGLASGVAGEAREVGLGHGVEAGDERVEVDFLGEAGEGGGVHRRSGGGRPLRRLLVRGSARGRRAYGARGYVLVQPTPFSMPRILRTPDDRFDDLREWPFEPRYLTLDGLPTASGPADIRIHYVDEGEGQPVLMLHGEPSWSYLYRRMIPPLAADAPRPRVRLPGFGRSDKPAEVRDYSFDLFRQTLVRFLEDLDLRDVTLVVQDWGGLIGLAVAALDVPERIARLVIFNTFLPTGEETKPLAFKAWIASVKLLKTWLPVGPLMKTALPASQQYAVPAYVAPFPNASFKAGVAAWPLLVPMEPGGEVGRVMGETREALRSWSKPTLIRFSDNDPFLGGGYRLFEKLIPHADSARIHGGGHFLQDGRGPDLAQAILDWMETA